MSRTSPWELTRTVLSSFRSWPRQLGTLGIWCRVLVRAGACLILLDIVRLLFLPPQYQEAYTNAFDGIIVIGVGVACGFAAARSSQLTRELWAMIAAYFALIAAADIHDFLAALHFSRSLWLFPRDFLGWFIYLTLALLIFFPTPEEGELKWKWLPVLDFAQVAIAIGLADFRFIYLQHLGLGRPAIYGTPEFVRNSLIALGLLLRATVEPSLRARAIYRAIALAFGTITILAGISAVHESMVSLVGRPAAFLALGVFAASWKDHSYAARARTQPIKLRMALSLCAAATLIVVLLLARHPPAPYRTFIYLVATTSAALFILRNLIADYTRHAAEHELRLSGQRYQMLFEKTVAGVGIATLEGQLIDCNDAWARIFGFRSVTECRGSQVQNHYLNPADREALLADLRTSGSVVNRELRVRRKDGTPFWVSANNVFLLDGSNAPLIQSTVIDITARKQAVDAMRAKEEHFRLLVEQASDGIGIADVNGRWIDVNSAWLSSTGYTREEFLEQRVGQHMVAEDKARVLEELSQLQAGETLRNEFTVRRKDGCYMPVEASWRRLPDRRLQVIGRDVTHRKRAEEALRSSEERFRVALKDSPITVFNQDQNLRYTWLYNPQLYGQTDVLGKTDDEILGEKEAVGLNQLKRRVLKTGTPLREEVGIVHEGKSYAFDLTIEPLFDASQKIVGITGSSINIARLRELADRLQEANDRLIEEKLYLQSEIQTELGFETVIGQSPALKAVLKKARVVAPADCNVLLLGETGTGKELVARSIHSLSSRRGKNFISLNCAAVPTGLLESELFGHEKGAFTSAVSQKLGRLELAHQGTLFLDEIGELTLELQPKLLRVLEEQEFERLGGTRTLRVDVRIISATNRDLQKSVAEKKFREDLFYRLNVFPIDLPPLRERKSDIPMLVYYFVQKHAGRMGKHIETVPEKTLRLLQNWIWPGNVRELENVIERMVILTTGSMLAAPPIDLERPEFLPGNHLSEIKREHILRVLRETKGVVSGPHGAAVRLGINRTTLQSMLKRMGIEPDEYRRSTGTHGSE